MSFYKWLMDTKFFQWGFNQNWAVWFHQLGGAVGARIGIEFWTDLQVIIGMLLITLGWELIEFIVGGWEEGMINIYGSLERWFYDSLGDVVGAMVMVLLVTLQ